MGTSGVALFLAEFACATSDRRAKQTALQAIEHAFAHLDDLEPHARPALYTGWLGIAFVCARAAALLGEPGLAERAKKLANRAVDTGPEVSLENDLLSGKAGGICALLTLGRLLDDQGLTALAQHYGHQLIEDATRGSEGWSWSTRHDPPAVNLTGLSHGTAGIALGLLELYHAGCGTEYMDAALEAFNYERLWFDGECQNWPDFREVNRRPVRGQTLPYFTAWCHGAPGIAVSRIRAHEILGAGSAEAPVLLAEADAALETTARAVETRLGLGAQDTCLCHGLTGNAEILLERSRGQDEYSLLARRVADAASPEWHDEADSTFAGKRLDLMTGLAGVGHFYLRLSDRSVPSVLLLRPETFAFDNHRSSV
jgi:lantibiotic modifying enzyme